MASTIRRWVRTAVVITAGVVLAAVPVAASARPEGSDPPRPGSEGLGDPVFPTYGNGGYRVSHYDIDVAYDPQTRRLTGTTTIEATATQALSAFHLDFLLDTESVTVNGRPATFSQYVTDEPPGWWGGGELVVTPEQPLRKGQTMTVEVSYADVPADVAGGADYHAWRTTPSGALVMGQPASAAWWYPVNDHPSDKATYDVRITVPEGKTAVSQGVLVDTRTRHGRTIWHWREDTPMVSYASFAAIGDYRVETGRSDDGVPLFYAFAEDPGEHGDKAEADIRKTGDVIDWHARTWGPYPFDVAGGVLADIGAGLETQTKPVYGASWWRDWTKPYPGWDIVVHENAHQWFGNSVSMKSYADFWMSEGFATFSELLWAEEHGGLTVAEVVDEVYDQYPADDPFWSVTIGSADTVEDWTLPMYLRGAMTLQALRTRVGDETFFALMRDWMAEHRGGNVSTDAFVEHAQRASGQDLEEFFDTWLFTPSRPERTPENGFPAS